MPSLVFRAVAGVVNGAACAVNHLVQVISPVDIGHIWDDTNFAGAAASLADDDSIGGGFRRRGPGVVPSSSVREDKQQAPGFGAPAGPQPDLAAPADPHPAGAADPAGGTPPPPAGSPLTCTGFCDCPLPCRDTATCEWPSSPLTWEGWATPAVLEVLSDHMPCEAGSYQFCSCGEPNLGSFEAWEWREHVAPLIAARLGCDPTRAALALTSLQTQ